MPVLIVCLDAGVRQWLETLACRTCDCGRMANHGHCGAMTPATAAPHVGSAMANHGHCGALLPTALGVACHATAVAGDRQ
jgi:hypothetical protein